jgi:hypothetical protein
MIEAQLAPKGVKVKETQILKDFVDGTEREIDVLIEIPSGPRTIRVAIECRDQKRPATIKWIDELAGKYRNLPVDRVVTVSKSGFSKAAYKKAAISKIDLLTLEEAENFNWDEISPSGRAIVVLSTQYEWTSIELIPPLPEGEARPIETDPIEMLQIYRKGGKLIRLGEVLHYEISTAPMSNIMLKTWSKDPSMPIILTLLMQGWLYKDRLDREKSIDRVIINLQGHVDFLEFWLQSSIYNDTKVAYAEAHIDKGSIGLAVIKKARKKPRWSFYLKNDEKYPWRNIEPLIKLAEKAIEDASKNIKLLKKK